MMTIMMMMMMIMTDPFTTNLVVKGPVAKGSVVKGAHPIRGVVMMMVTRVTCADIVTTSVLYLQRMFLEILLSFERMYLKKHPLE